MTVGRGSAHAELGAASAGMQTIPADLIATLYAAAADDGSWQTFLGRLGHLMQARSARLLVLDDSGTRVERRIAVNHDEHYLRQYVEHYVNLCPWRPELATKPDGRMYSSYLDFSCSQHEFLKSPFFHEWARPQRIHHGLLGTVYRSDAQQVQLMLQRERRPGHFTEMDKQIVDQLVPHLQRVCELRALFERGQILRGAVVESAERAPQPFLLLDEYAREAYVSPQAEIVLRRGSALKLRDGRLRCISPPFQAVLDGLISSALRSSCGDWSDAGGSLRMPCDCYDQLAVTVAPVFGDAAPLLFTARRAFAAIFLAPLRPRTRVSKSLLMQLFGLTPSEADVAMRLVESGSFNEAWRARGITENTARTLMKRIYAKLRVGSQADLVRVVLTSPAAQRPLY